MPASKVGIVSTATVKARSPCASMARSTSAWSLRQIDLRLEREAQSVVFDDLPVGLVDGILDDVAHDGTPVEALQMGQGDLAGPEPVDLHLVLHADEFALQTGGQVRRREHDLVLAPQSVSADLRNLHLTCPSKLVFNAANGRNLERRITVSATESKLERQRAVANGGDTTRGDPAELRPSPRHGRSRWCGRRDSNPHDVSHWNLNPARLPVPPRPRARSIPKRRTAS